jgi:type II secretory pathway component GspD/PulD (secretin)
MNLRQDQGWRIQSIEGVTTMNKRSLQAVAIGMLLALAATARSQGNTVKLFFKVYENGKVLSAPRVTFLMGTTASIEVQGESAVKVTVTAKPVNDKKFELLFEASVIRDGSTRSFKTMVQVEDGEPVLLGGVNATVDGKTDQLTFIAAAQRL